MVIQQKNTSFLSDIFRNQAFQLRFYYRNTLMFALTYNCNTLKRNVTLMLIKLASDILFSEKYLDYEIIVVFVGLEISRDRNIQI